MIDWNNAEITCSEFAKPRAQHLIHADLMKIIGNDNHAWSLISELENAAWECGVEEANAWQEAFKQDPYAQ
jgi:hypothetical protein